MSTEWKNLLKQQQQPGTVKTLKTYEKMITRLANITCTITFLKKCRDASIIPNGLKINGSRYVYGPHTKKAVLEAETIILKARIKDLRTAFHLLKTNITLLKDQMPSLLS